MNRLVSMGVLLALALACSPPRAYGREHRISEKEKTRLLDWLRNGDRYHANQAVMRLEDVGSQVVTEVTEMLHEENIRVARQKDMISARIERLREQLAGAGDHAAMRKQLAGAEREAQTLRSRRNRALEVTGMIGDLRSLDDVLAADMGGTWHDQWVRVWAIGRFHDERVVPPLIDALKNHPHQYVRRVAAEGLGLSRDPRAVQPLTRALLKGSIEYYGVRRQAAEALGLLLDDRSLGALAKAVDDKDWNVRWLVLDAIQQLRLSAGQAAAHTAASDEDKGVKEKAFAVFRILDPKKFPTVKDMAGDLNLEDRSYVLEAITGLGRSGDEEAVAPLLKLLQEWDERDETEMTRFELEDRDIIRWRAAWALGMLGSPKAVDQLVSLAGDRRYIVRISAAMALGKIGGDKARKTLETLGSDESRQVRKAAKDALNELGE